MKAPQIIMIALLVYSFTYNVYTDAKKGKGLTGVITSVLASAVMLGLLIWGGYFK